jgi:hypothetical protein
MAVWSEQDPRDAWMAGAHLPELTEKERKGRRCVVQAGRRTDR